MCGLCGRSRSPRQLDTRRVRVESRRREQVADRRRVGVFPPQFIERLDDLHLGALRADRGDLLLVPRLVAAWCGACY